MKYKSVPLPESPRVQREFQRVSESFETIHDFDVLHAPPDKPRYGMVRYADGTDWDPSDGEGPYVYTTTGWIPMWGTGGGGTLSPLTTKGDLYTYDTDDQRLPVGTDGYALLADSTQPTGIRWSSLTGLAGGGLLLGAGYSLEDTTGFIIPTSWTTACQVYYTKKSSTSSLYCIGNVTAQFLSGSPAQANITMDLCITGPGDTPTTQSQTPLRISSINITGHGTVQHVLTGLASGAHYINLEALSSANTSKSLYAQLFVFEVGQDATVPVYYVSGFYPGVPTSSAVALVHVFSDSVTFPAGLTDSKGTAETQATAQTDFDIRKNGVSVGTMRFAAGQVTASFIFGSQQVFGAGDKMQIVAPFVADATIANISFTLEGTR